MPPRPNDNITNLLTSAPVFSRQRGGQFIIIQGSDRGETVPIESGIITFGSSPSCTMPLTDKTVSRQHMQAEWVDGKGLVLTDLDSTNGTFFEGSRIREITINYGAEFTVGRTVIKYVPAEEAVDPALSESLNYGSMVGQDPKMRKLFALLSDISPTNATVIIEGETGTGKELVAEEIHNNSERRNGPFIVFDCGAVPRELIESSLFGHVKGSFTGAVSDRKGAFVEAHGGTIFLDEIGELNLDLQPALLRALDKRAIRRVGSNRYEQVDVRVIAATNRNLREEVVNKNFREDLYYRLAVIRILLPSLSERGQDIPYLAQHFVNLFSRKDCPLSVRPEDMQRLQQHSWPGNVRELRNVIERACVLAHDQYINLDSAFGSEKESSLAIRTDLPFKEAKGQLISLFEREYISDLMRRSNMNLSAAAREAQIDRKHLRELMKKYNIK